MLAYAANRRRIAAPRSAPEVMLVIFVAHIALIAAVMSAKMDLPDKVKSVITRVELIPVPTPPPTRDQPQPKAHPKASTSVIYRVPVIVPVPQPDASVLDTKPIPLPMPGEIDRDLLPVDPVPNAAPIRIGPRFATPAGLVRPPYPPSKLGSEEEAVLRLKLSIDENGRVVSVEPVGWADRTFLDAARRHILARWRYKPASEDGRPVASSTVITLRFELES